MDSNKIIANIFTLLLLELFSSLVKSGCPVNLCEWFPWEKWSDCSRECAGGSRTRDRYLCCKADLAHSSRLCMDDCGWDYSSRRYDYDETADCNTFCHNGGTYVFSGYCRCPDRYKGTCCGEVVTCGQPSSISHGSFSGHDFTYAGRVTYSCDRNYNMTDPSEAARTCTKNSYWSGSLPTCQYAVSCNSSPCKNGALCNNLLGDYRCSCNAGWSGKNCEIDIQPPIISGCPTDRDRVISSMTTKEVWTEPTIIDPHGTEVRITKNYRTSSFEFPWGEYTVHYYGVKPSNGLSAECKFKISVKPIPCKKMSPPTNGVMMCNGWRSAYSQMCVFECKASYTLPPGFKQSDIYVCGATGNWLPVKPVPQCVPHGLFQGNEAGKIPSCTSASDKLALAGLYIDRLKASPFNDLCQQHLSDCTHRNVVITC